MKYSKKLIVLVVLLGIFLFSTDSPRWALASQNDALNASICQIVREGRTKQLCNYLKIQYFPQYSQNQQVTYLNKKIRHGFGHTLANVFRTDFEPDYGYILAETLKKMNLTYPDNITIVDAELLILRAVSNGQRLSNDSNYNNGVVCPTPNSLAELMTAIGGLAAMGMMDTNWERTLASIVYVTLHRHGWL